jgi:hypothetical protein
LFNHILDIVYIFLLGHQIANGTSFVPNIITINEPHQQEFIVNLTEDGQQQLPSEQPPANIFNEISFHNITNNESDQVQMFQQPQLQQQPTFFINEDPDIDQIRIRSPPAIIQLDD